MFYADTLGLYNVVRAHARASRRNAARRSRVLATGAAARAPRRRRQDLQLSSESTAMTDAVIVSTARTGLAKSLARRVQHDPRRDAGRPRRAGTRSSARSSTRPKSTTCSWAARFPKARPARNIARQIALRAGCPVTVPGVTVNRFCSSGLQTIAMAAQRIIAGEGDVFVAGGVESISCVQNESNKHMLREHVARRAQARDLLAMLQTAENVAKRYGISREQQDEYGARSQQRAAARRRGGQLRRRDRADDGDDGRRRQGDGAHLHAGGRRSPPTKASAPTPPTKASRRSSPALPGGVDRGGQREPVLRRRGGLRGDERRVAAAKRVCSRSASSAASRSRAASPTRWASGRCSRCRSCSSAPA